MVLKGAGRRHTCSYADSCRVMKALVALLLACSPVCWAAQDADSLSALVQARLDARLGPMALGNATCPEVPNMRGNCYDDGPSLCAAQCPSGVANQSCHAGVWGTAYGLDCCCVGGPCTTCQADHGWCMNTNDASTQCGNVDITTFCASQVQCASNLVDMSQLQASCAFITTTPGSKYASPRGFLRISCRVNNALCYLCAGSLASFSPAAAAVALVAAAAVSSA